jgi:hypothetical protein
MIIVARAARRSFSHIPFAKSGHPSRSELTTEDRMVSQGHARTRSSVLKEKMDFHPSSHTEKCWFVVMGRYNASAPVGAFH